MTPDHDVDKATAATTKNDDNASDITERDHEGNASDHSSLGSPAPSANADESKKNKPKQKRKRLLKDINAPKAPLTGYVRFLNEHREKFREDHPDMPFHEVTKVLGQKWSSMTQEEKQQYLDEAEKEKEKYQKELEGYQQSTAYKEFQELKKRKEAEQQEEHEQTRQIKSIIKSEYPYPHSPKPNGNVNPVALPGPKLSTENGGQIPIFTDQFMEYSRKRESELRQLRKNNAVFEEQNALLNKQIDHMKNVMDRVKKEIIQQENENITVQSYLDRFRKTLVQRFEKIPIPENFSVSLNSENIEERLSKLHDYLNSTTSQSSDVMELKKRVRDVIVKLDFPNSKE